jgi:hypothetical protein
MPPPPPPPPPGAPALAAAAAADVGGGAAAPAKPRPMPPGWRGPRPRPPPPLPLCRLLPFRKRGSCAERWVRQPTAHPAPAQPHGAGPQRRASSCTAQAPSARPPPAPSSPARAAAAAPPALPASGSAPAGPQSGRCGPPPAASTRSRPCRPRAPCGRPCRGAAGLGRHGGVSQRPGPAERPLTLAWPRRAPGISVPRPGLPRPRRGSPVDMGLNVLGGVVVDDSPDSPDVQAARRDVGGDQHVVAAGAERVEHRHAGRLRAGRTGREEGGEGRGRAG